MKMVKSKFTVRPHYAFQDKLQLYLVMDLLPGGDLRRYMSRVRARIPIENAQFFIACLIQALEDVHRHGVIHRNVKPSNLIFTGQGYLCLSDFGLATVLKPGFRSSSASDSSWSQGTNWTAPEVISNSRNVGFVSDYWSIGVIAYQLMMCGDLPYQGENILEIRKAQSVLNTNLITKEIPTGWNWQAADFIAKCL